ncbi:acyltransferase family protein [Novosphingobium sp. 9]|uniref:acyltransferase family protein n=1 Tax=Novosphingobium sp. 9 TaxID=2025349 RepID=UPI0021B65CDC|nr:acyltransferase [Novosphingobium sp. 9]
MADEDRFLTRPLSVVLDLIRFGAAFLVLLGHAVQLRLWGGAFPLGETMQHNCVVVFFVLSGLVIATSALDPNKRLADFAISRTARILPVSVPALAFALLAALVLAGPHPVPLDNRPGDLATLARQTVWPLLFLNARPGFAEPVWNMPYWSLAYEVWYYALFAMALYLQGARRWIALIVGVVLAGPMVILLAPAWLAGVALCHIPALRRAPGWPAPVLLVLSASFVGWIMTARDATKAMLAQALGPHLSWSEWALADAPVAIAVVFAFVALRPLATLFETPLARLERPARVLSGFSFTLYLFHWPLLELARSWGIRELRSPLAFMATLAAICLLCWAISLATEHQSPRLRRWIQARVRQRESRDVPLAV